MSSGGREPLWARSLADQPQAADDDVVVRVLEEEPEEDAPAPSAEPRPARWPLLIAAALAAVIVGALAVGVEGRGAMTIDDVPSYWGEVPMTCRTLRIEQDGRAVEQFWCRALGGRPLPPGLYTTPQSQWRSDLTRQRARQSRIRITRDGEVSGWATY